MSIFLDYTKVSCKKFKQNKLSYSQELTERYKSLPKNLSLIQLTPDAKTYKTKIKCTELLMIIFHSEAL